jgi:hypothetical protein
MILQAGAVVATLLIAFPNEQILVCKLNKRVDITHAYQSYPYDGTVVVKFDGTSGRIWVFDEMYYPKADDKFSCAGTGDALCALAETDFGGGNKTKEFIHINRITGEVSLQHFYYSAKKTMPDVDQDTGTCQAGHKQF